MQSVMGHSFSQVPRAEIPRSSFDRSCAHKTTFDSGYLIPFYLDEALPGDTCNLQATTFARLTTPIVPVMDNMYCDTFYFAVPLRLLWSHWENFNGQQANPGDSTSYLTPLVTPPASVGWATGSLADYFGLPIGVASLTHTAFAFRAYNLIWNEWFRDQNMQNSVAVDTGDGPDAATDYTLLRRGKRHDYFTSCLPWPQKGTAVTLPLGTTAPIIGIQYDGTQTNHIYTKLTGGGGSANVLQGTSGNAVAFTNTPPGSNADLDWQPPGYGTGTANFGANYADLTNATAATINALRQAFQIQKLYERDARGGTRYTEIIRSHFGVISPDARLQRPEYLGGSSTPINVHPIAQTQGTGASGTTTPQGNLAAFATFSHRGGNGFVKSFTEHCVLMGLLSVRADLTYQQGLDRSFSRRTRWDYYWPALAHIGEQAVLNQEIYSDGSGNDTLVFGYQERYAEYRYKPSRITGLFRSGVSGSLDIWHLSQHFGSLPTLNSTFISDFPPIARIVAVTNQPQFMLDSFCQATWARPMPLYGVPGFTDRF